MKAAGFLNKIVTARGLALLAAAALVLLAWLLWPRPPETAAGPAAAMLRVEAVALDPAEPGRRRVGGLVFRRGWALDSGDPRFGGLSAMRIEGNRVVAAGDAGNLFEFALPAAAGEQPMRIVPLPEAGRGVALGRDAEALALHGRRAWIAFEGENALARLRRTSWRIEAAAQPEPMRDWRVNAGAEAMVRLGDGRFLILAEGRDDGAPFSPALLFDGDPAEPETRAAALRYRRPPGFRVTDAALLPDGRLLILARRFALLEGVAAKLILAEPGGLRAGATIEGRELATLAPPLAVDNMEALSIAREGGRTILWIASDDNFLAMQRTLLLEFELAD